MGLFNRLEVCFFGQLVTTFYCHMLSRKHPWSQVLPESLPPDDISPATPGDHSPVFHPTWEAVLWRPREEVTEMIK